MNTPFKFELSIIGLGYVGLPSGLQFTKSGVRFFEDHAVTDEDEVTAGLGFPHGMPTTNRTGRGWIGFGSVNADPIDQWR